MKPELVARREGFEAGVGNLPVRTLTTVRSSVRMRVDRRPMWSTVPTISPILRESPTRTAWSKINDAPAMTFSSVFCAPGRRQCRQRQGRPTPASDRRRRGEAWRAGPQRRTTVRRRGGTRAEARTRRRAFDDGTRRWRYCSISPVIDDQQPDGRDNREHAGDKRPELTDKQRQRQKRQEPLARQGQQQQTCRYGKDCSDLAPALADESAPNRLRDGHEQTVQQSGREICDRDRQEDAPAIRRAEPNGRGRRSGILTERRWTPWSRLRRTDWESSRASCSRTARSVRRSRAESARRGSERDRPRR